MEVVRLLSRLAMLIHAEDGPRGVIEVRAADELASCPADPGSIVEEIDRGWAIAHFTFTGADTWLFVVRVAGVTGAAGRTGRTAVAVVIGGPFVWRRESGVFGGCNERDGTDLKIGCFQAIPQVTGTAGNCNDRFVVCFDLSLVARRHTLVHNLTHTNPNASIAIT